MTAPPPEAEEALLARHGIVRVPTWRYQVGGYAYTSLADAVAQAKRGAAGGSK